MAPQFLSWAQQSRSRTSVSPKTWATPSRCRAQVERAVQRMVFFIPTQFDPGFINAAPTCFKHLQHHLAQCFAFLHDSMRCVKLLWAQPRTCRQSGSREMTAAATLWICLLTSMRAFTLVQNKYFNHFGWLALPLGLSPIGTERFLGLRHKHGSSARV